MLMATIILNKYQQHLLNFSSLVFNNSLQSTLESFACCTQLFLGNQVLFSPQVRLSILVLIVCFLPCMTGSIAYFACQIELFYHLANRFTATMQLRAMEELLWPFLWRITIVSLSIVIFRVKQLILTLNFLNLFINISINRFNPQLHLQRSEN